jgi:hypothetical protein
MRIQRDRRALRDQDYRTRDYSLIDASLSPSLLLHQSPQVVVRLSPVRRHQRIRRLKFETGRVGVEAIEIPSRGLHSLK